MKTNSKQHGKGSARTARALAGLVGGIAAATILGACGGHEKTTVAQSSTPAQTTTPAVTTPIVETTNTPEIPVAPPTAEEIKSAWQEGVKLYGQGDFEQASQKLSIAATGRPDDAYVQYLSGLSLWKSGHLEESETALSRSTSIHGGSVRSWTNLARVRLDRKNPQGALEAAEQALSFEPDSAQALHQKGRALDAMNRGDEAIDTLTRARQSDPKNGYIANTLGYLLLRVGKTPEAVKELEAARDALPGVAYVRNNLGVAYERMGEIDRAVAEFQAAVESGDSDGKASASLARLEPIVQRMARQKPEVQGEEPVAQNVPSDDSGQR